MKVQGSFTFQSLPFSLPATAFQTAGAGAGGERSGHREPCPERGLQDPETGTRHEERGLR